MKKVMPFVQFTKERISASGSLGVLELTLDYDEKSVLTDNMEYLLNNLQLEGMDLKFSEEADTEKTQEECRPGVPYVTFRRDPSVQMTLTNNQPHSGLFGISFPILQGDTVDKIAKRLARTEKNVKDPRKVKLYRFTDPVLGPRKTPSIEKPLEGKEEIKAGEVFKIDLDKQVVALGNLELGESLIYRID